MYVMNFNEFWLAYGIPLFHDNASFLRDVAFKDLNSTVAKRGSVFIELMTPNGAKWFRYQRTVLKANLDYKRLN